MKIMRKIFAAYNKVEKALLATILAAVTIMVFVATVGRYTKLYSIPIAEEFARYAIIWMAFVGTGVAGRENKHFNVPTIVDLLPARGKQFMYVFHIILMTIVTYFLIKYGVFIVNSAIKLKQASAMMKVPMWTVYVALPVGSILNWIGYVFNRLESIIQVQEEIREGKPEKGGAA